MDNRKTGYQSSYYLWPRLARIASVLQVNQGPVYCSVGNTDPLSTERSPGKGSSWKGLLQHTDENETSALARSTRICWLDKKQVAVVCINGCPC